jgi:hypothetical protein
MARLAASAMRFMRSLPMNARHFLTLRVNNLPEKRRRQYENKGDVRGSRRGMSRTIKMRREGKKRKFVSCCFRWMKCNAR